MSSYEGVKPGERVWVLTALWHGDNELDFDLMDGKVEEVFEIGGKKKRKIRKIHAWGDREQAEGDYYFAEEEYEPQKGAEETGAYRWWIMYGTEADILVKALHERLDREGEAVKTGKKCCKAIEKYLRKKRRKKRAEAFWKGMADGMGATLNSPRFWTVWVLVLGVICVLLLCGVLPAGG